MTHDDQEQKFDKVVEELREWLRAHCTPQMAISVMGLLTSELLFNYSRNTEIEVADFCARIIAHVHVLNASADDPAVIYTSEEVTLQ